MAWSPDEDQLLKQIVERYPGNWTLIADVFNSSRVTISTDKRTAWDCLARWDAKWNEGRILAPGNVPTTPGISAEGSLDLTSFPGPIPPTPVSSQTMWMMTRKRSAGQLNLSLNDQQVESRKRRRHNHMHDAMRKSAKKRESNKQNGRLFSEFGSFTHAYLCLDSTAAPPNKQRSTPSVHETHSAFNKPIHRTPAELSRLKAENDRRLGEERKRQEEEMRKRSAMAAMTSRVSGPDLSKVHCLKYFRPLMGLCLLVHNLSLCQLRVRVNIRSTSRKVLGPLLSAALALVECQILHNCP